MDLIVLYSIKFFFFALGWFHMNSDYTTTVLVMVVLVICITVALMVEEDGK